MTRYKYSYIEKILKSLNYSSLDAEASDIMNNVIEQCLDAVKSAEALNNVHSTMIGFLDTISEKKRKDYKMTMEACVHQLGVFDIYEEGFNRDSL